VQQQGERQDRSCNMKTLLRDLVFSSPWALVIITLSNR
jgi:hypothetical protein